MTERIARDITTEVTVLRPDLSMVPVEVTDTLYQQLDEDFGGFRGHSLISHYQFDSDWPTWEIHPAGDELVMLLSGEVDVVLKRDDTEAVEHLSVPGSYVIVPRGTLHTARTSTLTRMLFVTPGEGTENIPV